MTPEQQKALEELAARVQRTRGGECVAKVGGWRFIMDRDRLGVPGTHLSARLIPEGRSSTLDDWDFLGAAIAVLGASEEGLLTPYETTSPNATFHWHWGAPSDVVERIRRVIGTPEFRSAVDALHAPKPADGSDGQN